MNDLDEIRKQIKSEDDPGYVWFIQTISELCDEIEKLRKDVEDAKDSETGE